MDYRRLGRSGLKVSELSFGSWVTFGKQMELRDVVNSMQAAKEYGVNFFDNAEVYANGRSEELMGEAFKELKWDRLSYIVSTKFYWGITGDVNGTNTLNRKYLRNAIEGSLKRLQLEYVDLVYCHRPDPHTPIEETVYAMHDMIDRGQALYWGTSEWSADEIRAAYAIAERHHLHKPVMEQPQYNLFWRRKVEVEYARLYEDIGLGLTTWSPLASGVLTGKYIDGVPQGSRGTMPSLSFIMDNFKDENKQKQVKSFVQLSKGTGFTPAQIALAWCLVNPHISTVITGASRVEQIHENMKALKAVPFVKAELYGRLNEIFPV